MSTNASKSFIRFTIFSNKTTPLKQMAYDYLIFKGFSYSLFRIENDGSTIGYQNSTNPFFQSYHQGKFCYVFR